MNHSDFPPNWPSVAGGDVSTPKQRESRKLNWAKFMVDGMEGGLDFLLTQGAVDPYAERQARDAFEALRHSIAFQEKMRDIESEYRQRYGVL
jgi:hypothetical protein